MPEVKPASLAILLLSGTHERAHYALMLAVGAAAIGRPVVLFATNEGCRILLRDWSTLDPYARDATVRAEGVAGIDELRDAAAELGVRLLACEAGLRMARLDGAALLPAVEISGIPAFLLAAGPGPIVTL